MMDRILYLTTADTDLLSLAAALQEDTAGELPRVAGRNLTGWDDERGLRELDSLLPTASVVVLRLLGGRKAAPALFDRVVAHCAATNTPLLAWSADGEPHAELYQATTVDSALSEVGAEYAALGGSRNFGALVRWLAHTFLGYRVSLAVPVSEPWTGIYWPGRETAWGLAEWRQATRPLADGPTVVLLFYRAHWMSRNLAFVDSLIAAVMAAGGNPLPIFTQTLKDPELRNLLRDSTRPQVDIAIVTLSFSVARPSARYWGEEGTTDAEGLLADLGIPVLQAMVSLSAEEAWQASAMGLGPVETAMNVALPEFDGRIITVPVSFRGPVEPAAGRHDVASRRYQPVPDRIEAVARLALAWARLAMLPARDRRIALILTNYPSRNSRIGNAVGLDTPQSVVRILQALAAAGYDLGADGWPDDGDELMRRLIEAGTHDQNYLTLPQMRALPGVSGESYAARFSTLGDAPRHAMTERWGDPPGQAYRDGDRVVVAGLRFGKIFVGIQPPRQSDEDEIATYHSPDLPPTHHYLAYYHWLRHEFGADAVVHVGKHGTLEWLPGKGIGLSRDCYPEVVLEDLPNFYPFIVDDPGEGTQAKRRSHAVVVDHMVPPVMAAGLYDHLVRLQQLLDQYYQVQTLDPAKLPYVKRQIWDLAEEIRLNEDLQQLDFPGDFDRFTQKIDGYLCELESAQIRDGLHVLGNPPLDQDAWGEILFALLRIPAEGRRAFAEALAQDLGLSWDGLQEDLGRPWDRAWPVGLGPSPDGPAVHGDIRRALEVLGKRLLGAAALEQPVTAPGSGSQELLRWAQQVLVPLLKRAPEEIENLLRGLAGAFVPPGPSGAPTRGMVDVLPTGRNFYSVDPRSLPSWPAWQVGQALAAQLIANFREKEDRYPEAVGIVVWGTAAMRTGGDDIAEVLALLGVRPLWQAESNRITGLEAISLEELGRPRVDVTVRISGFFRDAFANLIDLVDEAVQLVARRDEPLDANPIRRHWLEARLLATARGQDAGEAEARALYRVFGAQPGSYGSGILPVLHAGDWERQADLAEVYMAWSGFAYGRSAHGVPARAEFEDRMREVEVATKNQDNREHDIFDSDDYLQDHGGMAATIRALTGSQPMMLFGDSSDPARAKVRSFRQEARRVFRSRVINPRWIAAVMRHGYKGALEMANTMDFLFGYDATADLLDDWMYEGVAKAYALDPAVAQFFRQSNPWALKDIAERLLEAASRELWENPDAATLKALEDVLLDVEASIEGWGDA